MQCQRKSVSRLLVVPVTLLLLMVLASFWFSLPVDDALELFRHRIANLGIWGVVGFVMLYSLVTVIMIPALPLTLTAGLVYGIWGFPLVVLSATLAACVGFLIARYLMRDILMGIMQDKSRFRSIIIAIGNEGWKVVVLVRLSPLIPFAIQNYLIGITDIKFIPYVIASSIGMLPACAFFVYIGSLGGVAEGGLLQSVFLGFGAIATFGLFWFITRRARQVLDQM